MKVQPLENMINRIENASNAHSKHDQILFTYGYILRLATSVFCCYYLRYNQQVDDRINNQIINELKRPSYGNLLAFIRTCTKSGIDWGICNPMINEFSRLFKLKSRNIPNIKKGNLILDSFITYRNSMAHGGAILTEEQYQKNSTALYSELKIILESLKSFSQFSFELDHHRESINLILNENELEISPLSHFDSEIEIGFMEGYNDRNHTIRYVGEHSIVESDFSWSNWESMLHSFSLLPIHYKKITSNWIRMRSKAIIQPFLFEIKPTKYRTFFEKMMLANERKNKIYSSDPQLSAFLFYNFSNKDVFFIELNSSNNTLDSFQIISQSLGIHPSINNIQTGNESILDNVLFLIYSNDEKITRIFKAIQKDFPNLEFIFLLDNTEHSNYYFDEQLYDQIIYDLKLNISSSLVRSNLKSIIVKSVYTSNDLWLKQLKDTLGNKPGLQLLEKLHEIILSPENGNYYPNLILSLKDNRIIETNFLDQIQFTSSAALEVLYSYILKYTQGRQKARLINSPPNNTIGIAEILYKNSSINDFKESSDGFVLWVCYCSISSNLDLENLNLDLNQLAKIGVILVRFKRPDAFKVFVPFIENLVKDSKSYENIDLELISLIRSHCDPQLSINLLKEISHSSSKNAIKAKHQLAGVFRDSREQIKVENAIEIYGEILSNETIDPEQKVWSTCGLAESYYILNDDRSTDILQRLLGEIEKNQYFRLIILHRLAAAYYHLGDPNKAIGYSNQAIERKDIGGKLGSRIYDTHSRILSSLNNNDSIKFAEKSLEIKKAMGDRRGIQISLLNLSQICQYMDSDLSIKYAENAYELAKLVNDNSGQLFALRRLKTLNRKNNDMKEQIQIKINKLVKE